MGKPRLESSHPDAQALSTTERGWAGSGREGQAKTGLTVAFASYSREFQY